MIYEPNLRNRFLRIYERMPLSEREDPIIMFQRTIKGQKVKKIYTWNEVYSEVINNTRVSDGMLKKVRKNSLI